MDKQDYLPPKLVAELIGKSKQTLILWDKYSDELESQGEARLIPKPVIIGNSRYWTPDDLVKIREFSNNRSYGDLARFNRRRWGIRGTKVQ